MMTTAALLLALITSSPGADAAGEPVLLYFHASWCGPCKTMRPAIRQLIEKRYQVKSVDFDTSPELAERYRVTAVPTFIVVDASGRSLARSEGLQPARQLADLYRGAKAKLAAGDSDAAGRRANTLLTAAGEDEDEEARSEDRPDDEADRAAPPFTNPKPWETVVRIKVHDAGSIGLGSGTIIHSTPQESIVLTCAHIFKTQGGQQVRPSQFSRKITVDLFDGKLSGRKPRMVHQLETVEGEVIDYDFARDVGLIRIRPGRRLPASRVVSASWQPESRMPLITVGCSEGHDATAWNTSIVRFNVRLVGNPNYDAIECTTAPKQGRSGGGLYTMQGYVAGVCDFAEPKGNHGLYASPRSIHRLLDRNRLTALYAPPTDRPGTMLAQERANPRKARATAPTIARAQSPDRDESGVVTIPDPELLGIRSPTAAKARPGRTAWQSPPAAKPSTGASAEPDAQRTELNLSPAADNDSFASMSDAPAPSASAEPSTSPVPARRSGQSKWRPVRDPVASRVAE